jgi:Tfp pilus assembly protein PilF
LRGGVSAIFTTFVSGNYHPLVVLTHAFEYRLFRLDPRPYHAVNIALHLLNTALVFHLLLLVLGGSLPAAVVGTLFFAVHPLRVESVAWVSDRKDLLGAAFFFGGIAAYLRHLRQPGRLRYALSGLLFLLALLSKATVVVFPLALLLFDWLNQRLDRKALAEKIPLFALSGLFGAIAVAARNSYQGVLQEGGLGAGETVFLGAYRLLCHYLVRSALPGTQAFPLYPPLAPGTGPLVLNLLGLAAVLLALGLLVALSLRRTRVVAFGALFFLVTLLPSLTVEVLGFSADRFTYLPAFGISCVLAAGFQGLLASRPGRTAPGRVLMAACAAAVFAALALASWGRCAVWRDSVSLWTAAIETYRAAPRSAHNLAYAYSYRGQAWERQGNSPSALEDLDRAVAISPGNPAFLAARGRVRAGSGLLKEARGDYDAAIRIDPRHAAALIGRGILAAEAGAFRDALEDFTHALEADPRSAEASLNLGVLHLNSGEDAKALPFFTRAAEIDPDNAAAFYGRARARFAIGDRQRAGEDLERAVALGYPDDPSLRESLRSGEGGDRR